MLWVVGHTWLFFNQLNLILWSSCSGLNSCQMSRVCEDILIFKMYSQRLRRPTWLVHFIYLCRWRTGTNTQPSSHCAVSLLHVSFPLLQHAHSRIIVVLWGIQGLSLETKLFTGLWDLFCYEYFSHVKFYWYV